MLHSCNSLCVAVRGAELLSELFSTVIYAVYGLCIMYNLSTFSCNPEVYFEFYKCQTIGIPRKNKKHPNEVHASCSLNGESAKNTHVNGI